MTVIMRASWNGYEQGTIQSLSASEEARLVAGRLASYHVAIPAITDIALVNSERQIVTSLGDVVGSTLYPMTNNYRLRCILNRAAGVLVDSGGRGFNGYAAAGNDQLWVNRGYFSSKTTAAGTDGAIKFSPQMLSWDMNAAGGQSLIISMVVNAAAPAAAIRWFGNSLGSTVPGFALVANTDGTSSIRVADNTGASYTSGSNTPVLFDGADHYILIAIDGKNKLCFAWVDQTDLPVASLVGAAGQSVALAGSTLNTADSFNIGNANNTGSVGTHGVKVKSLQILTVQGGLPENFQEIRKLLQADPALLITNDMLADRAPGAADVIVPITSSATAATKSLYRYLKGLTGRPDFLLGINDGFDSEADAPNANGNREKFRQIGGRYPAIMQWEYVAPTQPDDGRGTGAARYAALVAAMREHAASGGINMLCDHPGNPLTSTLSRSAYPPSGPGSSWDISNNAAAIASLLSGGSRDAQFLAYLDGIAQLSVDVGSPIILRLFHESNGNWFWWGGVSNATAFRNLWIRMVTYLRDTKGVTNFLYCLSPGGTHIGGAVTDNATSAYSNWYAGDEYVDVLALDYYNNSAATDLALWTLARTALRNGVDAMNVIGAPGGKPFMFAEGGSEYGSAAVPGLWSLWGSDMASVYRDACALALWKAPFGPTDPSHASAPSLRTLMDKDYCITLDKSDGAAYAS